MPSNHNDERIRVVYMQDKTGYVYVPGDYSAPTPKGFERHECHTLAEIDKLTARLNRQDGETFSRMWHQDRERMIAEHEKHKTSLRRRLLAADCSRGERLFILSAFAYFDRKEQEYANFKVRGYFHQREFDSQHAKIDDYGKQSAPRMSNRLSDILASCLSQH